MKIRKDFVTNSSSSSFVVAYKKFPEVDCETQEKYPFINCLLRMFDNFILHGNDITETEDARIINSVEELEKYIIENYSWSRCNNTLDEIFESDGTIRYFYEQSKEYINKGYSIFEKYVDYDESDKFKDVIHAAESEDFIVLIEE